MGTKKFVPQFRHNSKVMNPPLYIMYTRYVQTNNMQIFVGISYEHLLPFFNLLIALFQSRTSNWKLYRARVVLIISKFLCFGRRTLNVRSSLTKSVAHAKAVTLHPIVIIQEYHVARWYNLSLFTGGVVCVRIMFSGLLAIFMIIHLHGYYLLLHLENIYSGKLFASIIIKPLYKAVEIKFNLLI